jgi:hypothetical protein
MACGFYHIFFSLLGVMNKKDISMLSLENVQ